MRLVSVLYDHHHPFDIFFPKVECVTEDDPTSLKEGDMVILHGGADIHPKYYKREMNKLIHSPQTRRDEIEWAFLQTAIQKKLMIIGLCRGAQMLCAAAGGELFMDVNNHIGTHEVITENSSFVTNSIHHQMMFLKGVPHELLAWTPSLSKRYLTYEDQQIINNPPLEKDPEYVYFPDIRGHAIQWHPEMMRADCDAALFIKRNILKCIN